MTTLVGKKAWKLGNLDAAKTLTVAGYVGVSAALTSVAQALMNADLSTVVLNFGILELNGAVLATGLVNVLLVLAERLVADTEDEAKE